jgi:dTDP-4-dehydrorhamnose 3,5-epimerase-like enzyme
MTQMITFLDIPDRGDVRGRSFSIPESVFSFLGKLLDIHIASIMPGAVRGNHFHLRHKEVLIVTYVEDWVARWDEGEGTNVQKLKFSGSGTKAILIEPLCSHAIQNIGARDMFLIALSSELYDPEENVRRQLI